MARPVLPSEDGLFASSNLTFSGSTTNSFWPLSALSLVVATTWPVTRARNMLLLVSRAFRPCLISHGQDARATFNPSSPHPDAAAESHEPRRLLQLFRPPLRRHRRRREP